MRVYLDTRDLVGLLDRSEPCSTNRFADALRGREAVLALSPTVVFELAAPVVRGSGRTVVSRRLNLLEELPLAYLADWRIHEFELREAADAFRQGRSYVDIDPIVPRLDVAIDATGGRIGTRMYLNFPLAEIVLTIWQEAPDAFLGRLDLEERFRRLLVADRALVKPPPLAAHFRTKLRRDFETNGVPVLEEGIEPLADWIFEAPSRCPGLRLSYEVYHQIRANLGDPGFVQDFGDFSHVDCLPYVDAATLDRRMVDYVGRASRSLQTDFASRVFRDAGAILRHLESATAA
jgi:hypothetical protein